MYSVVFRYAKLVQQRLQAMAGPCTIHVLPNEGNVFMQCVMGAHLIEFHHGFAPFVEWTDVPAGQDIWLYIKDPKQLIKSFGDEGRKPNSTDRLVVTTAEEFTDYTVADTRVVLKDLIMQQRSVLDQHKQPGKEKQPQQQQQQQAQHDEQIDWSAEIQDNVPPDPSWLSSSPSASVQQQQQQQQQQEQQQQQQQQQQVTSPKATTSTSIMWVGLPVAHTSVPAASKKKTTKQTPLHVSAIIASQRHLASHHRLPSIQATEWDYVVWQMPAYHLNLMQRECAALSSPPESILFEFSKTAFRMSSTGEHMAAFDTVMRMGKSKCLSLASDEAKARLTAFANHTTPTVSSSLSSSSSSSSKTRKRKTTTTTTTVAPMPVPFALSIPDPTTRRAALGNCHSNVIQLFSSSSAGQTLKCSLMASYMLQTAKSRTLAPTLNIFASHKTSYLRFSGVVPDEIPGTMHIVIGLLKAAAVGTGLKAVGVKQESHTASSRAL